MAWSGKIRVPHFQRDFRWQQRDIILLFDSILRGYPVGSLLLWQRSAPKGYVRIGTVEIDAPEVSLARWVIDGQQRVTVLASALHNSGTTDTRFALAYDLRDERFVGLPQQETPHIVPLPVIFDLKQVLRWFQRFPEAMEYVDRSNQVTQTLRQYEIPAYEVVQDDVSILQDIFDRMNSYGKRLSRAEIFSGLFAEDEAVTDPLTFGRIAAELDAEFGFGTLDEDTIMRSVLARRGPDIFREIRSEFGAANIARRGHQATRVAIEFPEEDRNRAYLLGQEAMRRAVRFLQEDARVPHVGMLPYRYLFVVLTRFFAHHHEMSDWEKELLKRWFWRASVVGPERFKGNITGAVRALCFAVRPDSITKSLDDLLASVEFPQTPPPDLRRFRSNEAATKIVLCQWWNDGPRSFDTGEPFSQDELADCLRDRPTAFDAVRYLIPRMTAPAEYRTWAAERLLLPASAGTSSVGNLIKSRPLDIEEAKWILTIESHRIPIEAPELLGEGNIKDLLIKRQSQLQNGLTDFLTSMCAWQFEDTPRMDELIIPDPEEIYEPEFRDGSEDVDLT